MGPLEKTCQQDNGAWYCSLPRGHNAALHIAFYSHDFSGEVMAIWRAKTEREDIYKKGA